MTGAGWRPGAPGDDRPDRGAPVPAADDTEGDRVGDTVDHAAGPGGATGDTGALPASCVANGCSAEDCVCWDSELDPGERRLLTALAALHPHLDLGARGWGSEFVDGGVLLSVLDADLTMLRLHLAQASGVVYTVPPDVEDAEDMRDLLADPSQRRRLRAWPAASPIHSGPAWSRPAPGARPTGHAHLGRASRRPGGRSGGGRRRR